MKRTFAYSIGKAVLTVGCSIIPSVAIASQHVQFDVEPIVACQPSTPSESHYGSDRLLQARFTISSLLLPDTEANRVEYLFRLENTERTITIVDYEPKSSVRSPIVGNIQVHRSKQRGSTAGLSANARLEGLGALDGSMGHNRSDLSELNYDIQPGARQVAASGTLLRGRGAYFKFTPAPQEAREGARELQIFFRVSDAWRADYLRVLCEARDGDNPEQLLGVAHFIVALYRQDDPAARLAAQRLLESEQTLTDLAWKYRKEIERHRYASRAHEWAASLDLSRPKIPQRWLYLVLHRPTTQSPFSFESRLPTQVKRAAVQYARAKRSVHQLSFRVPSQDARPGGTEHLVAKPIQPVATTARWIARKPKTTTVD